MGKELSKDVFIAYQLGRCEIDPNGEGLTDVNSTEKIAMELSRVLEENKIGTYMFTEHSAINNNFNNTPAIAKEYSAFILVADETLDRKTKWDRWVQCGLYKEIESFYEKNQNSLSSKFIVYCTGKLTSEMATKLVLIRKENLINGTIITCSPVGQQIDKDLYENKGIGQMDFAIQWAKNIKNIAKIEKEQDKTRFYEPFRIGTNDCGIKVPITKGIITINNNTRKQTTIENNYITADEVECAMEWQKFLRKINKEIQFNFETKDDSDEVSKSQLYLGGPLANDGVLGLLDQKRPGDKILKGTFRMSLSSEAFAAGGYDSLYCAIDKAEVLPEDTNDSTQAIVLGVNDRKMLRYSSDSQNGVLVLARISKGKRNEDGTDLFCFGFRSEEARYFIKNVEKYLEGLYKKLKSANHLKNFFLLIEVKRKELVIENCFDLTNYMFSGDETKIPKGFEQVNKEYK